SARPPDRRQRLEPRRPRPARPRDGFPRPPLLAGVQPRRQLHRDRRCAAPRRARAGRPRAAPAATRHGRLLDPAVAAPAALAAVTLDFSPPERNGTIRRCMRRNVSPEHAGERLDRFLAALPEVGSRAAAARVLPTEIG